MKYSVGLKGGWVAPDIYYMGYANVINFAGLRIAGLSGIYKSNDYYRGHHEIPPYNPSTAHSAYHVRNLEIFRLSQIKQPIDIFLSHDWPLGIYNQANCDQLLRFKPFLADEINSNTLGSPESQKLLKILRPKHWFSAHLHVKFSCVYKHENSESTTKFLSLDKCLPRRRFLQVIDLEPGCAGSKSLSLDPEWLCILKKTDHLLSVESYIHAPISDKENVSILDKDLEEIKEDFQNEFEIPENFKPTAPAENSDKPIEKLYLNEQTTLMCEMLTIRDPIRVILEKTGQSSIITDSATQLYNDLLDEDDDDGDEN